jgi:hypothetical protein
MYFTREKSSQSLDSFQTLRDEKNRQVCLISRRRK